MPQRTAKSGYLLLHARNYQVPDYARPFAPSTRGIWCWAVGLVDLEEFYQVYQDVDWVAVRPARTATLLAYAHSLRGGCEDYAMKRVDVPPVPECFDKPKHLVVKTYHQPLCWCGCGKPMGFDAPWFDNPYAVWVEGRFIRRVTSDIRRLRRRNQNS